MTQTICQVCIMDTTDPKIEFHGEQGCSHCMAARHRLAHDAFPGAEGEERLHQLVETIKAEGKGKPYDCIIGLSGGVDSSYVAVRVKELGLRPLAVHLDVGWNSELATDNIARIIQHFNIDLMTHVVDWREVCDLQRACIKARALNLELVADHAIFALLYKAAATHGIRYIISGSNVATESIMPLAWGADPRDARNMKAIYKAFGDGVPLKTYPFLWPLRFLYYVLGKKIRFIPILNYGNYNKKMAIAEMSQRFGWRPYPNKHGESIFTRFYQDYYLPTKFGFDKRKAHYSSLIVSGEMTRDEALEKLTLPLYQPQELEQELDYVLKKLKFTREEFDAIMAQPPIAHLEFANNAWMFSLRNPVTRFIRTLAKGQR